MSKTCKLLGLTTLGVAFILLFGTFNHAKAAEYTISSNTRISGDLNLDGVLYVNHNWVKFNPIGWPNIDPTIDFMRGDSQIKEMGDLYLFSDDYLHLGPSKFDSGKVLIQNVTEMQAKGRTASGTLAAGTLETHVRDRRPPTAEAPRRGGRAPPP